MFETLQAQTRELGKPVWRAMLQYVADLHRTCTHPAQPPFERPWEEIGPGYCYAPAFGHWDIVHAVLDTLPWAPDHARDQLLNDLSMQEESGYLPAVVWMHHNKPRAEQNQAHPPVWVVAVDEYTRVTGRRDLLEALYEPLLRQIAWFEANRRAENGGFYYTDILNKRWESGVDEGVRFDAQAGGRGLACVDATSHVYSLYEHAGRWARQLGRTTDAVGHDRQAVELRQFIRSSLFDAQSGFFHDSWAVGDASARRLSFEGIWPVVTGAATPQQAWSVIELNLMNPRRFFTAHPISTVAVCDSAFELRMWRGPTWNSMTYWASRACVRYGYPTAARRMLERALDRSADVFDRTGTIWEFYHPHGGDPATLKRKPHTNNNQPCRDYLGHNPLIAMARMWERPDPA
jgi:glycogen debranching enzyme